MVVGNVVIVCGVFSDFGGNCATVNLELAVLWVDDESGEDEIGGAGTVLTPEACTVLTPEAFEAGWAGIEWAIGVVEHAGIGTTEADEKAMFETHSCAITP